MKLVTPVSLLIATALLAIYTVGAFQIALIEKSLPLVVAGGIAAIACAATALMKPASRLSHDIWICRQMGWVIFGGIQSGYFAFQYGSSRAVIQSVAPGLLMVALSCFCAWLVYRHFRSLSNVV